MIDIDTKYGHGADENPFMLARHGGLLAAFVGDLAGGAVDGFFKHDLPKLALEPDVVHHALFRAAPDLESLVADPLARVSAARWAR